MRVLRENHWEMLTENDFNGGNFKETCCLLCFTIFSSVKNNCFNIPLLDMHCVVVHCMQHAEWCNTHNRLKKY